MVARTLRGFLRTLDLLIKSTQTFDQTASWRFDANFWLAVCRASKQSSGLRPDLKTIKDRSIPMLPVSINFVHTSQMSFLRLVSSPWSFWRDGRKI